MNFVRTNKLIILILLITLLKGLIWAYAVPPFQAPDEQVHYASVQHYAEPRDYKPQSYDFPLEKTNLFDIRTQNLSPELRNFLEKIDFEKVRFHPNKKIKFASNSLWGAKEKNLKENQLSRFVTAYPAWATNYPPFYYKICGFLENVFASETIVNRVFIERIFSVFLTTLTVFFSYMVFREIKFRKIESALSAGIVSFQPMFTFISSSINVDALLFLGFSVFLLGAVRIINQKKILTSLGLIFLGAGISILSKPPGYFLIPATILLGIFYVVQNREKIFNLNQKQKIISLSLIGLAFISGFVVFWQILAKIKSQYFPGLKPLSFIYQYLVLQFDFSWLLQKSLFYWGDFGWLDTPISTWFIYLIWILLFLSLTGVVKILVKREENFIYVLFFALIIIGFGFMIHFVNLSQLPIEDVRNSTVSINIQGRYFFPVIIAKMALIIFGLSALFPAFTRKNIIYTLFIGMAALNLISLFNYVIPRFYL